MDSDDETVEVGSWEGVPGIIILINVYDPEKNNTAQQAHVATCQMIRHNLRLSGSHHVGVCLYGTEDSNVSNFGLKNITEIVPLSMPTLDDYEKVKNLNLPSYTQASQAHDLILSDVLWYCNKSFSNCKKKLSSRTVILLTRLDCPPIETDRKPTLKRLVDLVDSNIDVTIINMSKNHYKIDPFYMDFLINANKDIILKTDIVIPKPLWDSKDIEHMMHQQSHRHLAVARLTFEIGNDMSIGVGVYRLLKASNQNPHKKTNLDRDTNEVVTSVTKTMKVSTDISNSNEQMEIDNEVEPKQVPLLKSELLHYVQYGGERIEFTDNEKKKLDNPFGPPMMKLLGFKPASTLCKEKWFLKMGHFLFPNERMVEGSTVAFKALHKACMETSVVAICVLCTRVNAKPNIVALSPCTNPLGLNIDVGFDVIPIPFVENVRDIPMIEDEECMEITDHQKNVMKGIINNVLFDYKPDMFENPKLELEYRAIEAIALDENVDFETFIDKTKPNNKNFEKIRADLFDEIFGPFGQFAVKRSTGSEANTSAKRSKPDIDENLLQERMNNDKLNEYKVAELRDILKNYNCSETLTGLKKADLINLINKYCKPKH